MKIEVKYHMLAYISQIHGLIFLNKKSAQDKRQGGMWDNFLISVISV